VHGVSSLRNDERGAVVVLVAFLILPLALLLAFAIDTGNWWTHKRHLQTQADSGAFAAGQGPWFPTCDEATIEKNAAAYSGGTYNEQYQPSGSVHVLLNSANYYENGGANFSDTGTPCETLLNGGDTPAFVDVKATEANLANFFGSIPGFSSVTAHTHARVEIQGVQEEEGVRPIAVRNPSLYQCAHAQLWTTTSSGTLDSKLGPEFTAFSRTVLDDTSTQFQVTGNATMPTKEDGESPHVAVQVILGNKDCAVTDTYADPPGTYGVDFINVYSNTVTVGDGHEPELGSVSMPPGLSSCNPDPYFAVKGCTAVVKAYVKFAPGAKPTNPGQNAFITINGVDAVAATDAGGTYWTASVPIQGESGPNPIEIDWRQKYGTIPDPPKPKPKDCSMGQGCEGSFDVAQQGFGATDDDDSTNSGDLKLVQVADQNGNFANSLIAGTTHSFTITVQVRGLENSKPTDPPTILRNSNQSSKRTGLVDCGQGNGAQADKQAIIDGCPLGVYIWPEDTACVLPNNDPIDCVTAISGNRRQKIATAVADRIATDTTGYGNCGPGGNHWNAYRESGSFDINNFIQPDDPRLLPLIVTEPADLSGNSSGPPIPVRAIATFYVTGYDGVDGDGQGCNNEPYPGRGSDRFQIWGHWIKYVPVGGGVGNGKGCDPNKFGDCIAVLTQ
jgi:putative Flp pilus-assembly TadE/G-like protein